MRIKNNTSSVNTHRILIQNSTAQGKNFERLASGMKINRGSDGPAQLQISERLRAQTAGLKQAIDNSETSIAVMQTAEAALDEVSRALINARQLAVHAANDGANDQFMQEADDFEFRNIVDQINRISANTQFGKTFLLDGSRGGNGVSTGENLEFVDAGGIAKSSGAGGYAIHIKQAASRAENTGTIPLTQQIIDTEEKLSIAEGGRTLTFKTTKGDNVEQTLNNLGHAIEQAGLNLELVRPFFGSGNSQPQNITIRQKEYGSEHSFQISSETAGLLSVKSDIPVMVQNGLDVEGDIGGADAVGRGQLLTGGKGAGDTEGIQVRYSSDNLPLGAVSPSGNFAGTVTFMQNSLNFQIGPNPEQQVGISFKSTKANDLGNGVKNGSSFNSLEEASLLNATKARDSMTIIEKAIEEVAIRRGEMGAIQKNTLESNLNWLRIAHENVQSSESVIRDTDMASEMADLTRNQILMESSTSMLAHANQRPLHILKLIE